jgi:hypothetical protein
VLGEGSVSWHVNVTVPEYPPDEATVTTALAAAPGAMVVGLTATAGVVKVNVASVTVIVAIPFAVP